MNANMTRPTSPDTTRIALIGSGVTGCELLNNLCDKFRQRRPVHRTEISMFDQRGRFAAGDAFGTTWPTAVLNTDPTKMGPLASPGDFARDWVHELPAEPGSAMERRSFGEYTRAQMEKAIRGLAELGVAFRFVAEEITAIHPQRASTTRGYVLESTRGRLRSMSW